MAATKAPATKKAATTKSTSTPTTTKKAAAKRTTTAKKAPVARKAAAAKKAAATTAASFTETAAAKAEEAIKSFPSVDFSKLDVESLKQLDPRNIEMPDFDLGKLVEAARDAAYTIVGFGVLAVQRAQVQRREFAESISDRFGANRKQVEELIASFESRITSFEDAFEARIDDVVGKVGPRLPEQGEAVLNQVHSVAKSARAQVRNLLRSAA